MLTGLAEILSSDIDSDCDVCVCTSDLGAVVAAKRDDVDAIVDGDASVGHSVGGASLLSTFARDGGASSSSFFWLCPVWAETATDGIRVGAIDIFAVERSIDEIVVVWVWPDTVYAGRSWITETASRWGGLDMRGESAKNRTVQLSKKMTMLRRSCVRR